MPSRPGVLTFSPLALLIALSGLSTRRTRRIFTTLMALDLQDTTSYNTEVETSDLSNAADVKIDTLQQSKNVV